MEKADKSALIQIRLHPDEKQNWIELAESHGISLSEFIRERMSGTRRGRRKQTPSVDPILLREVARVGTNINQIAKALNRHNFSATDRMEAVLVLAALREWSEAILEAHRLRDGEFNGDMPL